MYIFLILLLFGLSYGVKVRNCPNTNPIINVLYAKVNSPSGVLSKDTVLTVAFENNKLQEDDVKYNLKFEVRRKLFFKYIKVPNFIITSAGRHLNHPHLRYIGRGVFQIGCKFLRQYSECPPKKTGKIEQEIQLKPIFEQIKEVGGTLGSWVGSGTYRINAKAWTADTREGVLCIDMISRVRL